MRNIDERLANALRGCELNGPVPLERIQEAQVALGLHFPPSYRRFLQKYGAALCSCFEVAGLPEKVVAPNETLMWVNVVEGTVLYRPGSLPEDSVAISDDGSEYVYFLHCSRTNPEYEGPVIEWGPEHDGGKQHSKNFLEFLEFLHSRKQPHRVQRLTLPLHYRASRCSCVTSYVRKKR